MRLEEAHVVLLLAPHGQEGVDSNDNLLKLRADCPRVHVASIVLPKL